MKKIAIPFLLALFMAFSASAQKVSRQSFKKKLVEYPTLPVEILQTASFKFYFPDASVNQDTLRKYQGSMDILKDDAERLSRIHYFPYKPIEMVNEGGDIFVEVAFGKSEFGYKQLMEGKRKNVLGQVVPVFHYEIEHNLPTIVKITDRHGDLLDIWKEDGQGVLRFGNEPIETLENKDSGGKASVWSMAFDSRESLENAYAVWGVTLTNRKAILIQARKVLESLYQKMYFIETKDDFILATGRGKDFDYSELDNALDNALMAIESDNYADLDVSIRIWKKYLEQARLLDKKAMINKKIAACLNGNIAITSLYMKDFDQAEKYAITYLRLAREVNANVTFADARRAEQLVDVISHRKMAFEVNGHLEVPVERVQAFDFKQEIGRRKKNKAYDLYSMEDKTKEFLALYQQQQAAEPVQVDAAPLQADAAPLQADAAPLHADAAPLHADAAPVPSENNPYMGNVQVTSTQGAMIMLNPFFNGDIVGQDFPEEITEITELNQIMANNMKFTRLPESIGNLQNLKKLTLKGNQLEEVPGSIGQLTELRTLDLSNNNLTSLPEEISQCKNLKSVVLRGNNISGDELSRIQAMLPDTCKVK